MIYFIAQTNQTDQKEAFKLEDRMQIIECRNNSKVSIGVIPGHYATNHSHVNYYVAMTCRMLAFTLPSMVTLA